jgi:hypothetical protein
MINSVTYSSETQSGAPGVDAAAQRTDWRLWRILFCGAMLGAAAVLPYSFHLIKNLPLPADRPPMPIPLVLALSLLQSAVLFGLVTLGGLYFARLAGMKGAPLLQAWLAGGRPDARREIAAGVGAGLLAGVLIVGVDAWLYARELPQPVLALLDAPLWQRLLAGILYGGMNEELLMRLFMVSLLAWLFGRALRGTAGRQAAVILAVAAAAVLFGLGHLPALAALTEPTAALLARTLILNGIAGIVFGYLYARYGLESAMLGHATAHLILQIPGAQLVLYMSQQ